MIPSVDQGQWEKPAPRGLRVKLLDVALFRLDGQGWDAFLGYDGRLSKATDQAPATVWLPGALL